ncbi:unnamed protein product [Rhizoctonia solani]|nr:unnamed protein product [Rhizoctonia solani]
MSIDPLDIAIKQWEDAHGLLSAALKGYLDSCTSLETILGFRCNYQNTRGVAFRIESTLIPLQCDTTQQLARITSTLIRTRNRLASPIFRLPDDVLLEIFLHVVYAPENQTLSVEEYIWMMHSSRYNLMAVCSDWRNFAYNQGVFWEVIPASDAWIEHEVTERSIQRAGNRSLRLVMMPNSSISRLIKIVKEHISRFCSLNVQSYCLNDIHDLIRQLSRDDSRISELSIHYGNLSYRPPDELESAFLIYPESLDQAPFTRLIQPLSVLRLSNCLVQWANTSFSDRLVELFIRGVKLPNSGSAMASFLSAIASANELRNLKVIDLKACYNPAETAGLMARPNIVFPKLQTLVLQNLLFNVLELLLLVIAPGSHHLTLNITNQVVQTLHLFDPTGFDSYEAVEPDRLIALLSRFNIDRLSLLGWPYEPNWLTGLEVRRLLDLLPGHGSKEMELDGWRIDQDFCRELSTTATSTSENERGNLVVPRLESLEFRRVSLSDEEGFKRLLGSIPVRKLAFEDSALLIGEGDWKSLEGDEDIIKWLTYNVPGLCFIPATHMPTLNRTDGWPLW